MKTISPNGIVHWLSAREHSNIAVTGVLLAATNAQIHCQYMTILHQCVLLNQPLRLDLPGLNTVTILTPTTPKYGSPKIRQSHPDDNVIFTRSALFSGTKWVLNHKREIM